MITASLGFVIILIVIFGYFSNWLNWRYLNYKITRYLYYIGAFVHESSHAVLCLATGAKIHEFKFLTSQPHVIYSKPKLPLIGNLFISSAPIFGGLLFLFLTNHYILGNYFAIAPFSETVNGVLMEPIKLITQLNLLQWQSWIMIALFLNIGAMIGPSTKDIQNVWPALVILLFIESPMFYSICLIALCLIFVNVIIQIIAILCLKIIRTTKNNLS